MKIKVCSVSFLNSLPFAFGLRNSPVFKDIIFTEEIPSVCASKLISGEVHIGLVPVEAIPELQNHKIISDYCIGAYGSVKTVMLFSHVPLNEITEVILDYRSRTSAKLVQVLAAHFWNISPQWKNGTLNYESSIKGTVAGLVIGDKAMEMREQFPFQYDLAEEWKKCTGMPFVFACWMGSKNVPDTFIRQFNEALQNGVEHIESACQGLEEKSSAVNYLTENISYILDEGKKEALAKFLEYCSLTREQFVGK